MRKFDYLDLLCIGALAAICIGLIIAMIVWFIMAPKEFLLTAALFSAVFIVLPALGWVVNWIGERYFS